MPGPAVPGYLVKAIAEAATLQRLHDIASGHLDDIGFSRFAFHLVREAQYNDRILTVLTDYPDEWLKRYTDRSYLYKDVVHNQSLHTILPFVWSRLRKRSLSDSSTLIFNEAQEFGLQDGISVPIRGLNDTFSLFSAVADGTPAEQAEALHRSGQSIAYLAALMHERTVQLIGAKGTLDEAVPHLTPREREVLKWVASGKTSADIADILKIAETTVNAHVASASDKLNATTRAHAAVLAILAGIVDAT